MYDNDYNNFKDKEAEKAEEKATEKNWDQDWDKDLKKDWDKVWDQDWDKYNCFDFEKNCSKEKCSIFAPTKAQVCAPTNAPTMTRTYAPTDAPTYAPTKAPTYAPTKAPTYAPTKEKTYAPAYAPTKTHTYAPTYAPTFTIVLTKGSDHECIRSFLERGTGAMSQKSAEEFINTFSAILKKGEEYDYNELEKDELDNTKIAYETLFNQVVEGFKETPDKGLDDYVIKEFFRSFEQSNKQ